MTRQGERCIQAVAFTIVVDGRPRRLCPTHARQVRQGDIQLWEPWTREENELLADPDSTTAEVAIRLGRSETAVRLRRFYAERQGEG